MRKLLRMLVAGTALACAACSGDGPDPIVEPPPACTFTNPVAQGADPWVTRHNGTYYLIQSRGRELYVSRSSKLTTVTSDPARVWAAPDTGWNAHHVWAPELHRIGTRWYIYYAAGRAGPPFIHQRAGVLESAGDDPLGPYTDRGMLYTGDDRAGGAPSRWAIDLTVGTVNGQLIAVWSGWENDAATDRTPQHLYAAPMSNPYTISGSRVRISSPVESWERGSALDLQEGPQFLQRAGQTFIIYSTRESWLPEYRLGQLRLTGSNPLSPAGWTKSGPVFSAADGVWGVGHASFTPSPNGAEDWIVYHAKTSTTPGWDDRVIRMQPFTWRADGSPDFGIPVAAGRSIAPPAGECTG